MKKQLVMLVMLFSIGLTVNAQKEYRLAKTTGHLKLNLNGAIIEGYDGKEIVFSNKNNTAVEVDERAKGLEAITTSGYKDNTGMGISVKENGDEVQVNYVFSNNSDILTIKVPQGMKVSFNNNSNQYYEDIIIKNIKGEIEVATHYNKIKLENNSGPMNISSINGAVEATFVGEIKGPISIVSIRDYVDITLPVNTKGNIELASNYGKIYAAKDFKIDIEKEDSEKKIYTQTPSAFTGTNVKAGNKAPGNQINRNTQNTTSALNTLGNVSIGYAPNTAEIIKGKLNGGGIDLIFKSINNNVYLRNK
ncbi:MAG: hypothetical protein EOO42_03805 [Flavobacteriales bacterium]|nr:MAG: hypothetical protein EOO42_03805 [Flavobacteriales bacterium]